MTSLFDFFIQINSPEADEPGKDHTHLKDKLNTLMIAMSQSKMDIDLLDVGCGLGILPFAVNNANRDICRRIRYVGIDENNAFITRCKSSIQQYNWNKSYKEIKFILGDFFEYPFTKRFDYAILANALHEISPLRYFDLFIKIKESLKDNGMCFIFDMDNLPTPEINAISWTKEEIETILNNGLNLNAKFITEGTFTTTKVWYCLIPKSDIEKISNIDYNSTLREVCENKRSNIINELTRAIQDIQFEIKNIKFPQTESNDNRIKDINFKWIITSNLTCILEMLSSPTTDSKKGKGRRLSEFV